MKKLSDSKVKRACKCYLHAKSLGFNNIPWAKAKNITLVHVEKSVSMYGKEVLDKVYFYVGEKGNYCTCLDFTLGRYRETLAEFGAWEQV